MSLILRDVYIKRISPYLNKPIIKVLTGMRRTGKSSIVKMLIDHLKKEGTADEEILYINKESLEWEDIFSYKELYREALDRAQGIRGKLHLFVDEVQEIEGWEKAINSLLTDDIADIVITGSNARLLSSDISGLLSGRYIEFPVQPLIFREFLHFRGAEALSPQEEFYNYLKFGGMPGIHLFPLSDEITFSYLNALYDSIMLKDVINRHQIRDPSLLNRIVKFVFDNCGNISTAKRISNFLRNGKSSISVDKVINYTDYLEQAFLVSRVFRYDIKGLRHLELYEKLYTGDIGLRHGFLGYRDDDISGLLENILFLELKYRGYSVSIGKLYDLEIDFIAEKPGEKIYLQVAKTLGEQSTIDREFTPLEKIRDNHPKVVLTMDTMPGVSRNGIASRNLVDFLLE